jgi:putative PEP-CTERM system histidine kinase
MGVTNGTWIIAGQAAWSAGALACFLAAAWLLAARARYGIARRTIIAALGLTGTWALAGALTGFDSQTAALAESLRNLAWIFVLYRLYAYDGRHASMRPVRPMLAALAFVELLQASTLVLLAAYGTPASAMLAGFHTIAMLHVLTTVGGLVLVHNLYGGASGQARLVLRWPALALATLWIYDLNHYAIGYLGDGTPQVLAALRGLLGVAVAALLAVGARGESDTLRFRPSRTMAFQSVSLLMIGGYLVAMVALAQWLAFAGGDFAAQLQLAFVAIASLAALAVLPSRRLRAWLRVMLTKHLFQHRYDYRAEWLRFTRTIGAGGTGTSSIEERVIRAVADITDSPAGMLLSPDEAGQLELAARWQWPTAEVPAAAMDAATARHFEGQGYIADLDELRAGRKAENLDFTPPEWLLADPRAWALVPLLHYERLVGVVVLARPPLARKLDWEDFDLLRVAGQQLASYLAEHSGQAALAEAGRFDDFHRRIAFVMHDIKNLASQLSLLARNAELHAENPEFRADMLVTLRNSADKLGALLARLSRYGPATIDKLAPVRADAVVAAIAAQFEGRHQVTLVEEEPCEVAAAQDELEQVVLHLVQNAVDASEAAAPVFLRVANEGPNGVIEVVDSGCGMSAEFVRNRLFKPFDSTKPGGFGIGAYEARELVKVMNGRLEVESREGLGTRFVIRLPRVDAAELLKSLGSGVKASKKVA